MTFSKERLLSRRSEVLGLLSFARQKRPMDGHCSGCVLRRKKKSGFSPASARKEFTLEPCNRYATKSP